MYCFLDLHPSSYLYEGCKCQKQGFDGLVLWDKTRIPVEPSVLCVATYHWRYCEPVVRKSTISSDSRQNSKRITAVTFLRAFLLLVEYVLPSWL